MTPHCPFIQPSLFIDYLTSSSWYFVIHIHHDNYENLQEEEIGIVEEDLEMFYGKWSK